ncbi:MAG: HPr kinase/phosphorylase [Geminicoccaceae bacterium]
MTQDRTGVEAAAIHASLVAWCGHGILIRGDSGAGKTALCLELMAAGAYLVADDLVRLAHRQGILTARAAGGTGLIELRCNGIFRVATSNGVRVSLCVELQAVSRQERLPETGTISLAGMSVPLLRLPEGGVAGAGSVLLALFAGRGV